MLVVLTAKKIKTLTLDTYDASDMMNLDFKFSDVEIRFPLQNILISIHTANRMLKSFVCLHYIQKVLFSKDPIYSCDNYHLQLNKDYFNIFTACLTIRLCGK